MQPAELPVRQHVELISDRSVSGLPVHLPVCIRIFSISETNNKHPRNVCVNRGLDVSQQQRERFLPL